MSAIGQSHEYLRTRFNMEAAAEAQSIPEARPREPAPLRSEDGSRTDEDCRHLLA